MTPSSKITASHLSRLAIVYVRPSAQVRQNTESTQRQYGLAGNAAESGWLAKQIVIVDADLGVSGRFGSEREGYREIVARLCMGEVGAVFGLEVSRLGRSNADLSRLMELARLTDTLLIDTDGVYDLANVNDRILLGLKGQMSEIELHFLLGRSHGAKLAAARNAEDLPAESRELVQAQAYTAGNGSPLGHRTAVSRSSHLPARLATAHLGATGHAIAAAWQERAGE